MIVIYLVVIPVICTLGVLLANYLGGRDKSYARYNSDDSIWYSITAGALGFFLGLIAYAEVPCLSFSNSDPYWVIGGMAIIIGGISAMQGRYVAISLASAFIGLVLFITIGTTWSAFHSSSYRNLIGEVKTGTFQSDVPLIEPTQVRVVDESIAHRRMEELMGSQPGLGSKVVIGHPELQAINGKLFYVSPLEPVGFWSWKSNDGTPGYIVVSAINSMDSKIVLNKHLRYTQKSWFNNNLERHIRSEFPTVPLTDFTFMVSPEEKPTWVVTTYENTIGLCGAEVTGAVLVDAETGVMKRYATKDVPAWASRIQPADLVEDQIEAWGKNVHGWWNPSGNDIVVPTRGMSLVETKNGRTAWYVGIQSSGADKGTTGFMLVDTNDKTTTFYHVGTGGVNETGAREALEGKVQQFRYGAGHPVMYNIGGEPTYIAPLKDAHGNLKQIGICNVSNRAFLAVGDSLADALAEYKSVLSTAGNHVALEAAVQSSGAEGTVTAFATEIYNGRSRYLLMLDTKPHVAFRGNSNLSMELPLTAVGNKVSLSYEAKNEAVIDMLTFKNASVDLQVSPEQKNTTIESEKVRSEHREVRDTNNAEAAFSKLTPQEKVELLKKK